MRVVKSISNYIYDGQSGENIFSMNIESFSKILNFIIFNNEIRMIYECDINEHDKSKIVNITISKDYILNKTLLTNQSYHSSIVVNKSKLDTISNGRSIDFNLLDIPEVYHIFTQEIKPLIEKRDEKLNEIINGKVY